MYKLVSEVFYEVGSTIKVSTGLDASFSPKVRVVKTPHQIIEFSSHTWRRHVAPALKRMLADDSIEEFGFQGYKIEKSMHHKLLRSNFDGVEIEMTEKDVQKLVCVSESIESCLLHFDRLDFHNEYMRIMSDMTNEIFRINLNDDQLIEKLKAHAQSRSKAFHYYLKEFILLHKREVLREIKARLRYKRIDEGVQNGTLQNSELKVLKVQIVHPCCRKSTKENSKIFARSVKIFTVMLIVLAVGVILVEG